MEKYTWRAVIKEGMKEEGIKGSRRMQLHHLVRRQ